MARLVPWVWVSIQPTANATNIFEVKRVNTTTVLDVDTVNGYVGVGTGSPTAHLDVVGQTAMRLSNLSNGTPMQDITFTGGNSGGGTYRGFRLTGTNNTASGPSTITLHNLVLNDSVAQADTIQGSIISINDTGSGAKNITGLTVDNTGSTNASATQNGILVNNDTGNAGNLLALQGSGVNLFAVSNAGQVKVGSAGTATGQLFVGGTVPTAAAGSVSTGASSGAYSVAVQGKYAYAITNTSAKIQAYDVSNPASPVALGTSINTDASGGTASPKGLTVSGRYAYVANEVANTVSIIDISNPTALVRVGAVTTGSAPRSVAVSGRYAYVVNSSSNTIQALDVSNPAAPIVISSRATQGTTPRQVIVQGRYAYIASEGTTSRIEIMDVNDPANMVQKGTTTTNLTATQGAFNLQIQGKYLYVLDYAGKFNVYDVSDPTTIGATSTNSSSTVTGVNPRAMVVQGRYAYVVTESDNKFIINDISNPASVTNVGSFTVGGATKPWWVAVQGRYAYIVTNTTNTLQTIDLGGTYTQQLEAGSLEVASTATADLSVSRDANVVGGLQVGQSLGVTGDAALGNALFVSSDGGNDATYGATFVDGANTLGGGAIAPFTAGWTTTGWGTITASTALHTTGNTNALVYTGANPVVGTTYEITYTYNNCSVANNLGITMGGQTVDFASNCQGNGTYSNTKVITATSTAQLTFSPSSTFVGTLSGLVIRALNYNAEVLTVRNAAGVATLELRSGASTTNTFVGLSSGAANITTTGINNTAFGSLALQNNTSGNANTAIGYNAMNQTVSGAQNVALGYQALRLNGSGGKNVAIGYNALQATTTASNNVAVGTQAGGSVLTGTSNLFIGHQAGLNDPDGFSTTPTVSNSAAIGPRAQVQASNSIVIGDTDSNQPKVGIGSTIPLNMFSVSPVYYSTAGNAAGTASQSTNTITAVGATFTNAMIGMQFIFADGTNGGTITGTTATTLTVTSSQTVSPAQAFRIHVAGFQTTTNGTSFVQASSSTAFSVQTAAGVKGFTVDTATNGTTNVVLGTASSNVGVLQFANSGGANLVSIQAGSGSAAYALTLPTTAPAVGQCLQNDGTTVGTLVFASCGGAGSTLQGAYTASTGGTTSEIVVDATRKGLDIQDRDTGSGGTIGATETLLNVRASAAAGSLGTSLFAVNASGKVGINLGTNSTTPTIGFDLTFGPSATRVIGVNTPGSGAGSALTVQAGAGATTNGANLSLLGGAAGSNGNGGSILVTAADSSGIGNTGGSITIKAGAGGAGTSGDILIQGGAVSGGGSAGSVIVRSQASSNSTTAFQVQNASNNNILSVDTSANNVIIGKASTVTGILQFANSGGANLVSLQAGSASAAYALTLPTVAPSTGQCLQSGAVTATLLTFGSCAGGGGGLAKNASDTSSFAVTATNNLYTFTNSSSAVASGVLKLDNGNNTSPALNIVGSTDQTGYRNSPTSSNGLIQNYVKNSEEFEQTTWSVTGTTTRTANTTLGPDAEYMGLASQQTADTIASGATASSTIFYSSTNALVGQPGSHTFSIWLRSSSGTPTVQLRVDDASGTPAGTAKSITLSTVWQRFFVTQDTSTFTTGARAVIIFPTSNTTVIAWGAQLSMGAQAGPYAHTQANEIAFSNWQIGLATQGLYVQGTTRADGQPSPSPLVVQGGNGFNTVSATGNSAGALSITGGTGGTASGAAGTGGAGAAITLQGGNGGAQSGTGATTGGAAGAISIFAGAGASGATGSAGATVTLRGGAGGNGTTTNGAGGSVIALVGVPGAGAGAAGAVGSFIVRPNGATGNGLNFQVQNNASAAIITGDTSTRTLTVNGTTGQTTAAQLVVTGSSYAHAASETGSVATLAVTDATITAGSPVTNGLSISSTVNVTTGASGTKTVSALNVGAPTLTACTGGTNACIWNGGKITTQSTGAAASITQNGINIAPAGISAGTLNGVLVGNITSGASANETGVMIGQGYDVGLKIQSQASFTQTAAATGALIDFATNLTPSNAGGFANTGLKVTSPVTFVYTAGATTFTGVDIGNSGTTASTTGGTFAFTGVNMVVPNITLTTTSASGVGLAITTGAITQTAGTASMTGIDITLNTVSGTAVSTGLRIKGSGTVPTSGTTERLIDVRDSSNNNLLEVRDMSALNNNFGAAATSGAFISRNSYQDLEYNKFLATNTDAAAGTTNTNARRGDSSELATSSVIVGTTTGCSYASAANGLGGQETITAASAAGTSDACAELATTATAGTSQKNYASNNLPVMVMKVRPTAAPTANSNSRMFFGLADNNAASLAVPTNGIFFTNCTATTPTCTSAKWIGMVVTAGAATTVTCNAAALENTAGNINFTSFNYLRIEVRANNNIHFFVDTDVSTGIVETECGTGITAAGPGATALTPYLSVNVAATATTLGASIDYMRIWQDDAAGDPVDPNNLQGQQSSKNASSQITQAAATLAKPYDATAGGDLTEAYPVDDPDTFAPGDVVSIDASGGAKARKSDKPYDNNLLGVVSSSPNLTLGSAGEKTINVGVAGRVPVKVSTENGPIAPGDLLTASSVPGVAMRATKPGATIGQALDGFSGAGEGKILVRLNVSGHKATVDASDLQAGPVDQATIGNLKVTGDMVVEGVALFRGKVTVAADLAVAGHISVGEDVAGSAVIPIGKNSVNVKFAKPYAQVPVVTTSSDDFVAVRIINKTVNGFTIEAQSPVVREIKLDWTALEPPEQASSP